MSARQPFVMRQFVLRDDKDLQRAAACMRNAPLDPAKPLELVIREAQPMRKKPANDRMWAGQLKDIEQQAWVDDGTGKKRRYRDVVWHDYFKRAFLPEQYGEGITRHVEYRKWAVAPDGERVLVGSTKDLTPRGFALYLQEVEAFGANLGVQFSAAPHEVPMI